MSKILIDRAVVEQALNDVCGAKLCEINSMSSRAESRRLLDNVATTLRSALAEQPAEHDWQAQAERSAQGWMDRALKAEKQFERARRWAIAAGVPPEKLDAAPEAPQPKRAGQDDYKAWYEEAMCASNEAGFVGLDAAQTIRELARLIAEAPQPVKSAEQPVEQGDDFSQCKPPMHHIPGVRVDLLRKAAAPEAPQPKVEQQEPVGTVKSISGPNYENGLTAVFVHTDMNSTLKTGDPLYTAPQPAKREPLTPREIELIDGMIEVQMIHAEQCDRIANRAMAEKQKGWDMERVALLQKLRATHGIKESKND